MMESGSYIELRKDLHELQNLRASCSRHTVQKWLDERIDSCSKQLEQLKQELEKSAESVDESKNGDTASSNAFMTKMTTAAPLPTIKIIEYAWDQSEKFVKLYVSLPSVHTIPAEQLNIAFSNSSVDILAHNVSGKNYSLTIKGLLSPIDSSKSMWKQKTDMLLIMMKKVKEGESWKHLTKAELQSKEKKTPHFDDKADPQESLMNMMKQLYEEGDDDMKRQFRKSWHEARKKDADQLI